jgi:hypothetical protein
VFGRARLYRVSEEKNPVLRMNRTESSSLLSLKSKGLKSS